MSLPGEIFLVVSLRGEDFPILSLPGEYFFFVSLLGEDFPVLIFPCMSLLGVVFPVVNLS